jgi:anaerobic ribonucleoside-triphosphate reductase activating protein
MNISEDILYDDEENNVILHGDIGFHDITHDDMKNGTGLRVVLWVAGCNHKCAGCQNPVTWDADGGIPFTQWEQAEFFTWLDKPWTEGATFSGGDPLHPRNRKYIGELMKMIKETRPGKNIWVYTGYSLKYAENKGFYLTDDVIDEEFVYPYLQYIDVLIDGRFECDTRREDIANSRKCLWRGSTNQHVIDVQASLKTGKIIISKEEIG